MKTIALIVGAGRGHRFGGTIPKQYCDLNGTPVLRRTVNAFMDHPQIHGVACVINPDDCELYESAVSGLDLLGWVAGGDRRQDSVRLGLEAVQKQVPDITHILVHDAARPFVTPDIIQAVLDGLSTHKGVIPAIALTDTLKRATDAGFVQETVPRHGLWRVQTPQGFHFGTLIDAHQSLNEAPEFTDDAALLEEIGVPCQIVPGAEENIKITTQSDLAKNGDANRPSAIKDTPMETRTGLGFDVHKLVLGGPAVILGGIAIPHDARLKGHSDADVALHALTDAILGAMAEGDIGTHFPPSDPQWKGVSSHVFLEKARDLVKDKQGLIINVDITIICEDPKVGPYRQEIQENIAGILGITSDRVSVKATTTERLGFTGRNEGIAAQAMATLSLPPQ